MANAKETGLIAKKAEEVKANTAEVTATTTKAKNLTFSAFVNTPAVQKAIMNTLQDSARAKTFTSSIVSAVTVNPDLRTCDPASVVSAALLGESLGLSPSPQLGNYYIVPFNAKAKYNNQGVMVAPERRVGTFQIGWKGYYKMAAESQCYKKINVEPVKEGELISWNPFTEEIVLEPIADPLKRESAKTIGYYAYFELLNGFRKEMYWSKEKMEQHAMRYSQGYRAKKGYTFWEKDFDGMGVKTMYRQLLGKYGILNTRLERAFANDMTAKTTLDEDAPAEYVDNDEIFEVEAVEVE